MLCRRKIELYEKASDLAHVLIKREILSQSTQAYELVERAKLQADHLVSEAVQQRDTFHEQANLEFWRRADRVLGQWEHQRLIMCEQLERYATAITNEAFCHLLEEVPPAKRLTALIKQLTANQLPSIQASLLCHPPEREDLECSLAALDITLWTVRPDERVKPQALVLETTEGDFHIDWHTLRDMLLIQETLPSTPKP